MARESSHIYQRTHNANLIEQILESHGWSPPVKIVSDTQMDLSSDFSMNNMDKSETEQTWKKRRW